MRRGITVGLLLALIAAAGRGEALSPKARKLADKGIAACKQGHALWRKLVIEEPKGDERFALVKEIVDRYDKGIASIEKALEIQEHAGLRSQLSVASRQAFKIRAHLFWLRQNRKLKARREAEANKPKPPPDAKPKPKPEPGKPETQEPETRKPEPSADDEQKAPDPDQDMETVQNVTFQAGEPPAIPHSVDLLSIGMTEDEDADRSRKRDERQIRKLLKTWLGARKKLTARHALCRGAGKFSDGAVCEECAGTGRQVNLHQFRKAYWSAYTPVLRGTDGAWAALESFRTAAQKNPAKLGAPIKSFSVTNVSHRGLWAKAAVRMKTADGTREETFTVISLGRAWYLYSAPTDSVLARIVGDK